MLVDVDKFLYYSQTSTISPYFSQEEKIMKRSLYMLLSLVILASMMLTACGAPAATEAPAAPAATEAPAAPAATEAPAAPAATEAPVAAPFVGEKLAAPDCNYGGNIKSIEAIDELTVKFSFCASEPAFLAKVASNSQYGNG